MVKLDYEQDRQDRSSLSLLASKKSGLTSNSRFYSPISSSISTLSNLDTTDPEYLKSLPSYMSDGSFGVDMVRVSLTVDPNSVVHADFLSNVYGSDGNKTSGIVKLQGQPNVYMFWPDTGKQIMSLHFNPSNFSRIDGFEICPPTLLSHYVAKAIKAVLNLGDPQARPTFMENAPWGEVEPWPRDWTEHIGISTIHLARDLSITDPRFNLEQLRLLKPKRMGAVKLIIGSDGEVETVTHTAGKDTARQQIYNKHRERKKLLGSNKRTKSASTPIAEGTYRYEIQVPRVALRKNHIYTLDVMTPERLHKMALGHWDNSNYSTPLIWEGQIGAEMSTVMSDSEIAESLQYIRNLHLGVEMGYSPKEIKRIERLIKKAGVSQKKKLNIQGLPYGFLDFKAGGLVELP
jgi:hypothetical protein